MSKCPFSVSYVITLVILYASFHGKEKPKVHLDSPSQTFIMFKILNIYIFLFLFDYLMFWFV